MLRATKSNFIMLSFGYLLIIYVISSLIGRCESQTTCSLKVPVPDTTFCDASGSLEANIESDVYETKGMIYAVQSFQNDHFKLFDNQARKLDEDETSTTANIRGIEEEILSLKGFLNNFQIIRAYEEAQQIGSRHRRAAATTSLNQTTQLLDQAKVTFKTAVTDIFLRLQNLSRTLAANDKKDDAGHFRLQQELLDNQQELARIDQQLTLLAAALKQINQTSAASGTGPGVSVATVMQDVIDLIVNGSTAGQVAQRELDRTQQLVTKIETDEAKVAASLAKLKQDFIQMDSNVTKIETDVSNLQGGEQLLETQFNFFSQQTSNDIANMNAEISTLAQNVTQMGKDVFQIVMSQGGYRRNLDRARVSVDGLQSLVTLATREQRQQVIDILHLRKETMDDINLMKFAFGIRKTFP